MVKHLMIEDEAHKKLKEFQFSRKLRSFSAAIEVLLSNKAKARED